jgi:hypothetical protein
MRNVKMTVKGTTLVIEVDLAKRLGPSGSGKTMIIASTDGSTKLEGDDQVSVGLNVYTKDLTPAEDGSKAKGKGK